MCSLGSIIVCCFKEKTSIHFPTGSFIKICGSCHYCFLDWHLRLKTTNVVLTGPSIEQYHNQICQMVSDIKIFKFQYSEHIISLGNHVEFPINTNQNLSLSEVLSLVSEEKKKLTDDDGYREMTIVQMT